MYRLLIADDEKIIVEGLALMFGRLDEPQFEIHTAANGREALATARRMRIDVLLSDIAMPELDGIGLQREISRLWPRCRIVFLSGYNDFGYIQSSLRGGAIDYVLKTEGDDAILNAVRRAVQELEAELRQERLLARTKDELRQALPSLRKEYLLELLAGAPSTPETRRRRFAELEVPLRPDLPVRLLAGRADVWRDDLLPGDRALLLYGVNNMFEEFFSPKFRSVFIVVAPNRFVWLMQPRHLSDAAHETAQDNVHEAVHDAAHGVEAALEQFVAGTAESLQEACSRFLKLVCSFVVGAAGGVDWSGLPAQMDRLSLLFATGLGSGRETLLTDKPAADAEPRPDRTVVGRIPLLAQYLEDKDREAFHGLLREISAFVAQEQEAGRIGGRLEIFCSLSAQFAGYLNRRGLFNELAASQPLGKLFSIGEHPAWDSADRFFTGLAEAIFDRESDENEKEIDAVVVKLHRYIDEHLYEPLSLTYLSEVVFLTPSYLSRLYKQRTGVNLTDHIIERKIRETKRLLADTPLKVQEIGETIGYPSPSYFSRFFKRETGLTPQEYRDSRKTT